MLARGAPLTFVSHQLGHSAPATTLRHYAHWIPGEGAAWVDLPSERSTPGPSRRRPGAAPWNRILEPM